VEVYPSTLLSSTPNAPPYPEGDRKGPIPASTLPSPLQRRREANESHHIFSKGGSGGEEGGDPCGRPRDGGLQYFSHSPAESSTVARSVGYDPSMDEPMSSGDPSRATIKALPTPHHPPSPLRMLMGFSSFDAYYYTKPASLARMMA